MTVRELIEMLEKLPSEDRIYFDTKITLSSPKPEYNSCFAYEEDKEDNGEEYDRPAGSVIVLQ